MNISSRPTQECTPRALLKRIPDTEQGRADLMESNAVGQACRTATRQDVARQLPQAPPVAKCSVAKASERASEDASVRRNAKAQDLTPPVVPHVIPVPRAADNENEPSQHLHPRIWTMEAFRRIQPVTITRRFDRQPQLLSSPDDRTNQSGKAECATRESA